jgi:transposase
VVRMVHGEGKSLRAVAHHYHVGHSTVVRALERARLSNIASQRT